MSGLTRPMLWATVCLVVFCVLSVEAKTTMVTRPSISAPMNIISTRVPSPAVPTAIPAKGICEKQTNCVARVEASLVNRTCLWVDCQKRELYCASTLKVSDCVLVNRVDFCSLPPPVIPVPTSSEATTQLSPSKPAVKSGTQRRDWNADND